MLKKIGIALGALIAVFLVVVALQPAEFRIERKVTVDASAAAVFKHVEDFHAWSAWSPWEKLDPSMQRGFEGPAAGQGAIYTWKGNDDVGSGKMTITEATAPSLLVIRLEFIEPFASLAETRFTFTEEGGKTVVSWAMSGTNDFAGKAFGLLMDMDAMVGADFENGLASLKGAVEAGR